MSQISTQTVYQALQLFYTFPSKQQFEQAQKYLRDNESNPLYPGILLSIFDSNAVAQIKERAFVIFTRVIKNNWVTRGNKNRYDLGQTKTLIKSKLLEYIKQPAPFASFPRHLKDIICAIARHDYPSNWESLHQYILQTLKNVATNQTLQNLWALSIVKQTWKQKSQKKAFPKQQQFQKYALPIVQAVLQLENIYIKVFKDKQQNTSDLEIITSRYLDKILLSCLCTMGKQYQADTNLGNMIILILGKIDILFPLLTKHKSNSMIEKSIKTIISSISTFQGSYPFAMHNFISQYFRLIFTLLSKGKQFKSEDTIMKILSAGIQILKCTVYYFNTEQFESFIFFRKSQQFKHLHTICHNQFVNFFNEQTIKNIFKQLVFQTFSYRVYTAKDSIDEEQVGDRGQQVSIYLLSCGLVCELMRRFKQLSLTLVNQLISQISQVDQQIQMNIISILLVVPKVYESQDIPIDKIFTLLEYLVTKQTMHKQFALITGRYAAILVPIQGQKIFDILINIITTSTDIETIYEVSMSIKKALQQQTILDLSNLHKTILVIVSCLDKYEDPTLRWYLVTLVGRIISLTQFNSQFIENCLALAPLQKLCSEPAQDQTMVYSTCDMLSKFVHKSTNNKLFKLIINHIDSKLPMEQLQTPSSLFNLWLEAIKKYQPSPELNTVWVKLLQKYSSQFQDECPAIFCEVLSQYLLLRLITPGLKQISGMVMKAFEDECIVTQSKSSYLEMYSVFNELNPPHQFSSEIIKRVFTQLDQISQLPPDMSTNLLRSSLISIVNQQIVQNVEQFNNNMHKLGLNWISTWLTNTRSLTYQFTFKLNALALIIMVKYLDQQLLCLNINNIFHQIIFHLEPGQLSNTNRRHHLQSYNKILTADLKPMFKQTLLSLMQTRGITQDWLVQNLQKMVMSRLKEIMNE